MRNTITNPKTIRRLERETGLKIDWAQTRGGTDHRYDLYCTDGTGYDYYRGGKPTPNGSRRTESGEWKTPIQKPIELPVADQAEVSRFAADDIFAAFAVAVK
jgi:hypothetical protein